MKDNAFNICNTSNTLDIVEAINKILNQLVYIESIEVERNKLLNLKTFKVFSYNIEKQLKTRKKPP